MCLAIPMRVVDVDGNMGTVEAFGVRRTADLVMVQPVEVGSYVLVHAGFALQVMDEESAIETLGYFEQMSLMGEEAWEEGGADERIAGTGAPGDAGEGAGKLRQTERDSTGEMRDHGSPS